MARGRSFKGSTLALGAGAAMALGVVADATPVQARDITMTTASLSNRAGTHRPLMTLERGQRYKIRVSNSTHFGTWPATRRDLKNDACFEFNSGRGRVPLPVVKNSHGFNLCQFGYRANHRYESQTIYGDGRTLSMWVYDTDYRDNFGSYYVEVILVR